MGKTALVLSGGGFRGAFQVGALQVLRDNWHQIDSGKPPLHFDIVSGVSVGALNGLLTAQNKFDDLVALWDEIAREGVSAIYQSDFLDIQYDKEGNNPQLRFRIDWATLKKYFPKTSRYLMFKGVFATQSIFRSIADESQNLKSIADNKPLFEKIKKYARKDFFGECIYQCGFVSLDTGSFYSMNVCDFDSDEDFAKGVLASTAMPIIWPPVDSIRIKGQTLRQCVDGGIRNVSPLRSVIDDIRNDSSPDDYTIIIVNCSAGNIAKEDYSNNNIAQIALRSLYDIAITEIFNNDIREFLTKNFLVKQIKEKHPHEVIYDFDFENRTQGKPLKHFKTIVIQPDAIQLGDSLTASSSQIKTRMEHGQYKARLALDIHEKKDPEKKETIV